MATYITQSPGETTALAQRLARTLRGGELIAFTGGMGAGKTTFCTGIAQGLGSADPVSSPTFAIANVYRGNIPFAHFDAYRITGESDLEAAGFYDYLESGMVVAVEWSERVEELLPDEVIRVGITAREDGSREIAIEGAEL